MVHFVHPLLASGFVRAHPIPHRLAVDLAIPTGGDSGSRRVRPFGCAVFLACSGIARAARDLGAAETYLASPENCET